MRASRDHRDLERHKWSVPTIPADSRNSRLMRQSYASHPPAEPDGRFDVATRWMAVGRGESMLISVIGKLS